MNRQLLSQTLVVLFALTIAHPQGLAAGSSIEDMEPPFGSGYAPEQESQKLANKGYRSYQQALYYQSLDTPNDAAKSKTALKKAQKYLRQAAKKDQKNVRAFALLGDVLAMQGERRKAIGAFNFALQLSPKYYDAWLSRAEVLLTMGLVGDVQKSYAVLARNEPDLASELLAAIDIWLAERELPLSDADSAFMEWRTSQN
jgi:tetratricopeptide (TPR) repeat protein